MKRDLLINFPDFVTTFQDQHVDIFIQKQSFQGLVFVSEDTFHDCCLVYILSGFYTFELQCFE